MGIGMGCFMRIPVRDTEITIEGIALVLRVCEKPLMDELWRNCRGFKRGVESSRINLRTGLYVETGLGRRFVLPHTTHKRCENKRLDRGLLTQATDEDSRCAQISPVEAPAHGHELGDCQRSKIPRPTLGSTTGTPYCQNGASVGHSPDIGGAEPSTVCVGWSALSKGRDVVCTVGNGGVASSI